MKFQVALACLSILGLSSARAELEPPVPVRTVAPIFPSEMRREHISGLVFVDCLIDTHGDVTDEKVKKASNDAFVEPALAALKKWKFKPAQRDGNVIPIRVAIPVKFTIED